MASSRASELRRHLSKGQVIPALPLALNEDGTWSERHQRALVRYYREAGAGGLAVAVHSTQFAIRKPEVGLFRPLLEFVVDLRGELAGNGPASFPLIAGVSGQGPSALKEAELAAALGYEAVLVSPNGWGGQPEKTFLAHCREVSRILPVFGFYLQPAVGGRELSYAFWREFASIESVVAIKAAPFDRYRTLDVARALMDAGRSDLCLYTGNDDNIVFDLLASFRRGEAHCPTPGGLLGHWGVWTSKAVELLSLIKACRDKPIDVATWRTLEAWNTAVTDANAVVFDAAHGFRGCIPGIMETLRRQGLAPSRRCLDPHETLSPGQAAELDRIYLEYPFVTDDDFVRANLDRWLS